MDEKNTNETAIIEMSRIISEISDPELLADFFKQLYTPREYEEIAKRWLLVKKLHQGVSQRRIADQLGISLCKITRGSRELKKESSAFRELIIKTGKDNEKT